MGDGQTSRSPWGVFIPLLSIHEGYFSLLYTQYANIHSIHEDNKQPPWICLRWLEKSSNNIISNCGLMVICHGTIRKKSS